MAHAKARVAPRFDVAWRSTESPDQEIAQPLLGSGEVVGRIHRPEDVIRRNLTIERRYQALKAVFSDDGVELVFIQTLASLCIVAPAQD